MLSGLSKFFPGSNHRLLNKMQPIIEKINGLEKFYQEFPDEKLFETTFLFKERVQSGESLDEILPEAFALVREAAKRVLGQRHFDVQLMGGIVLNQGRISEMKTGEGKTLVATLAAYLNSLESKGVHVITVNDYLSKRDAQWMGSVFGFLGISTAALQNKTAYIYDSSIEGQEKLKEISRKEAYNADITYGTNSEFGFDYLRDNMISNLEDRVQRPLNFAIVDEVDNILIDEARTPLIISGPAQESTNEYKRFSRLVSNLSPESDYVIEQKHRTVSLTQEGISRLEQLLNVSNLYDYNNLKLVHFAENALKANALYKKDVEYVIKDGSIVIVDEFTGRLMYGRRYSDGIHQALEAKENLSIQRETMTFASITIQNYFRMYPKLSGMTGTAATESEEFHKIYKLDVVEIPTNKTMLREDKNDLIFRDQKAKYNAVVSEIQLLYSNGIPVLVGTTDIAKSELISGLLKTKNIPHQVLNAKLHEKEAEIVAQAGKKSSVTIATNMAGRGTDIVLGGNPESLNISQDQWNTDHENILHLGGLHIIGTERHEARRIDNQLRGRAGRQGDPGNSRFFVALDDDLMKRFGGDTIRKFMDMAGMDKDIPIENQMITRQIESAQVKVEGYHFDIRKNLVEYDDVVNAHRTIIYSEREKILNSEKLTVHILSIVEKEISEIVGNYTSGLSKVEWDIPSLIKEVSGILNNSHVVPGITELQDLESDQIQDLLFSSYKQLYYETENAAGDDQMREFEKQLLLHIIDGHWVFHLTSMENLRQGIGLQAVGQRDPLVAYKKEAHDQFQDLLARIEHDIARGIFSIRDSINLSSNIKTNSVRKISKKSVMSSVVESQKSHQGLDSNKKVGRNEKCPCGSGKKYKKCCATES
ncbi:MAG: preprotein translocase subunit SecA [SAR202 cluster bacterium]|nr:preprotein translocase subunit SecA [SAR202 cluster bacterium]|tara:strand:- start:2313 stop:4940 length:2628 start_codon:yes stop_codon:yes gene_type:complete